MPGRWVLAMAALAMLVPSQVGLADDHHGDSVPYTWHWNNVHWPSASYYFTYGPPTRPGYRVFYPSPLREGGSYYVTPGGRLTAAPDRAAEIEVVVPSTATVLVDGEATLQPGSYRTFRSPPIATNREYVYLVQARWREDGREVTKTQKVTVHGGSTISLDFRSLPADTPKAKPGL